MKRIRTFICVLMLVTGALPLLSACKSKLAAGGAYSPLVTAGGVSTPAPDMNLFLADASYQLAYNAIDGAFTIERNNRILLWSLSPQIKKSLDALRPKVWDANKRYLAARAAYIANPIPSNLTGVQSVLAEIQQLAVAVQAALPKQ